MRIRDIALDDDELPVAVTVAMSLREAALILRMIGQTSHSDRTKYQQDGGEVGTDIWAALSGSLFNRFWDDGVDEVPK